ncbi:putative acyl- N-acyltransferase [Rosellinia necatrix]|uniref:Putative acyl-N-acyltransferase n=1 Tax=Rosellinia necatrix TaxID=77044 RepID=A0A1W2TJ02_ROSNE|nr:putative acyl- N-acyltransferase [Rosellinia necatrix]
MHIPYPELPHRAPRGFRVRDAELSDAEDLTRVWFAAFHPSHEFYRYTAPDDAETRKWLNEFWELGIMAGPSVVRTFVVEDVSQGNKLVAVSRWHVPYAGGIPDIPVPTYPARWDQEVSETLWGGLESRERTMGSAPHWMADYIAIDEGYQNTGIAFTLADWGMRQAAATGLEIYAQASIKGLPVWKHYGCKEREVIEVPSRPGHFEAYRFVSVVWTPKTRTVLNMAKL